jgi:hypothetical protein
MFASTDIREHLASQAMCSFTGQDYGDALESLSIALETDYDVVTVLGDEITSCECKGCRNGSECLTTQYLPENEAIELIAASIEPRDVQCRMINTYLDDSGNTVHVYESLQDARMNLARAIVVELASRVNN